MVLSGSDALLRAAAGPPGRFREEFGKAPLLCVNVAQLPDVEAGLLASAACSVAKDSGFARDSDASPRPLDFRTAAMAPGQRVAPWAIGAEGTELSGRLRRNKHFVIPLVKRSRDSVSLGRVSVGRARSSDIVLRHASISKFHAWFEFDAQGVLRVADAASRNGTSIGTQRLSPRSPVPAKWLEPLLFGSVSAFVCEAGALWSALH